MNQTQVRLYHTPSFLTDPLLHLQEIWSVILADFQSIGMSFQRVTLLAAYTIELLHQARSLPPQNKQHREQVGRFLQWYPHISMKAQGQSIVSELMMTGGNLTQFQKLLQTRITYMLGEWSQTMKLLKKNKQDKTPIDIWGVLNKFLTKPQYDSIYDKLLFIQFIKNDLTSLEQQWLIVGDKQLQNIESVIRFLTFILPKVLFNITVQNEYFPKIMTEQNQKQTYEILYLNENKHTQLMKRVQFQILITTLIQNILKRFDKLSENDQIALLDIVINYFYAYHTQHSQKATKFLNSTFEKLSEAVRVGKIQSINIFLTILEKLQYNKILQGLYKKFGWIKQLKQKTEKLITSSPRDAVEIFFNEQKNLIVPASQKAVQLVEVFRPYSLVYFDINCKAADIDVNFCFAGNFDGPSQLRNVIFEKKRLKAKQKFNGSIQAVQPGLYYFQFNNTYSWMTAKAIGYKLEVVTPMDILYPFEPSPYSRFLISQISYQLPHQLTVDYDFFGKKDLSVMNSFINQQNFCNIKVSPPTYLLTVGLQTYQLQTQNIKSVYQKLSQRIQNLSQKYNIKEYLLNQEFHKNISIQQILKKVKSAIQNPTSHNDDKNSPVESLNDLESNKSEIEVQKKKSSKIQSKSKSSIKTQNKSISNTKNKEQKESEQLKQQKQTKQQTTKENKDVEQNNQQEHKEIDQQTL